MIGYVLVGSNDLEKGKAFYDTLMASIGAGKVFDHGSGGRVYGRPGEPMFGVVGPYNGQPATVGNGTMISFALDSREQVAAFHAKVLELGGTCEGAPGPRGPAETNAYMAYMRDLDGNKLCAMKLG
jgi:catechol 2,3-dioxygenase-like lactoylglutathione lyase family enzyme